MANSQQALKFDSINKNFLRQIESIKEVLPLVMILINANDEKTNLEFVNYVKKHGKAEQNDEGKVFYTFHPETAHYVSALEKNAEIASTASNIIPNSLFVSLISQFDCFIGELIREIFTIKPEILNASEKNITFSKLVELETIENAKELIIEKEVESILRESHSNHFDWLENKLNLKLRKDLPAWQTFIEITERRNLFVHCNGVVSSQYLMVCKKNNVTFKQELKNGEELHADNQYIETAFNCLYEISTKLTQVIWRKLCPEDLQNADSSLNDICFELIKNGQYELSNNLLDFATGTIPKPFNEESKNVFVVNRALSLKLGGEKEKAHAIIKEKDWSATSNKFKLATAVLLDQFEQAAKIMKNMGQLDGIGKLSYKTWPLFVEFRKSSFFIDAFKEVFEEDYASLETPKTLIDQLHSQVEKNKKERNKLSITSFLEITKAIFPTYQFIPYRADYFVKTLLGVDMILKSHFEKALNENIDAVRAFNDYIVAQVAENYLNPYTMIRHCLYIANKEKYAKLLFDVQITRFENWINSGSKKTVT